MFNNALSAADYAAINGSNRGNDDFIFILLLVMLGRGGLFGGADATACCHPATNADVQRGFDNQEVLNKLNGLENGLASLGYDQLVQMNGINQNISNAAFGIQRDIFNSQMAQTQATHGLSQQVDNCCCQTQMGIAQARFDTASMGCDIKNAINMASRDIIENQNQNYRALHEDIVQMQLSQKDARISELTLQLQAANFAQSQCNQSAYLVSQLRPCPVPAYSVPNPYATYTAPQTACPTVCC